MIVRLMGLGQWRLDDALQGELNAIDAQLDTDVNAADGTEFAKHLQAMHDLIKARGAALADDELLPSDAVVPPVDISLDELREFIGAEGLIPG